MTSCRDLKDLLSVVTVHREVQESETEVVWTRQESRPRIRRTKDYGDDTTWEKKVWNTEAEMDGLCQPGHDSHRNDKR